MKRMLKLTKQLELSDVEGLKVNGAPFKQGKGMYTRTDTIVMDIPNVFRFSTQLQVAENKDNPDQYLILAQFLTRGAEMWEMDEGFDRIGFKDPEIETELRQLCENLVSKGLAEWIDITKEYFDKNDNLIQAGMTLKSVSGEIREVSMFGSDNDLGFTERAERTHIRYQVDGNEYFPLLQYDLSQWEIEN